MCPPSFLTLLSRKPRGWNGTSSIALTPGQQADATVCEAAALLFLKVVYESPQGTAVALNAL